MKKLTLVLIACMLIWSLATQAQTQGRFDLNTMEITDANGVLYPSVIAQKLLATGKYGLRINKDGKTALLYELSIEEINIRMANAPKPKESTYFKTGSTISSFKESDMAGNKYNLKEMAGKVVVINFWFINCPPCRQEIPQLNEVVELYKENKDVVFIALALDDKYELEEFLKTTPFKYNVVHKGGYIAQKYGVNLYPTHVILDKQGKVLFHTSGFGSGTVAWIRKSIEAGLNNTVPN